MTDISFLIFKDDQGHYRLENNASNEQERIDMTAEEAEAWIDAQAAERLTLSEQLYATSLTFAVDNARRWVYERASALAIDYHFERKTPGFRHGDISESLWGVMGWDTA